MKNFQLEYDKEMMWIFEKNKIPVGQTIQSIPKNSSQK